MRVFSLLFISVSELVLLLLFMGKLFQALKAKDRVFSSALPADTAAA
jgi:hypothetical protein